MVRRIFRTLLWVGTLAATPAATQAAEPESAEDWQYNASLYLWGAAVSAATAADRGGGRGLGSDVDMSFRDVLKSLNFAFMGAFEVRKARWFALGDLIYLNLGADKGATVAVPTFRGSTTTFGASASADVESWLVSVGGGYNAWHSERGTLDVLIGARYLDTEVELDLGTNIGRFAASVDASPQVGVVDAVVGIKGRVELDEKWYAPYYVDIGTGQSDVTWQVMAGVSRRFEWGDVSLAYRHMDWNFESREVIKDFSLSGPLVSATFRF